MTDKELADLKSEFGDALGIKNGDDSCEDKLNELLEALVSKTTSVKDLADSFFGGRNKLYGVSENVTTIRVKLNGKWTAVGRARRRNRMEWFEIRSGHQQQKPQHNHIVDFCARDIPRSREPFNL
ncbi:MAG: hypothetical protein IPK58_08475 [Acidobacteria bacterium]|nr:hypothetical protein [Acidobacteriota bacterium]